MVSFTIQMSLIKATQIKTKMSERNVLSDPTIMIAFSIKKRKKKEKKTKTKPPDLLILLILIFII